MAKFKMKPGVVTGNALQELHAYCKEAGCALPAVNVIGSSSINAALQAAREASSAIIIQFSNGAVCLTLESFSIIPTNVPRSPVP